MLGNNKNLPFDSFHSSQWLVRCTYPQDTLSFLQTQTTCRKKTSCGGKRKKNRLFFLCQGKKQSSLRSLGKNLHLPTVLWHCWVFNPPFWGAHHVVSQRGIATCQGLWCGIIGRLWTIVGGSSINDVARRCPSAVFCRFFGGFLGLLEMIERRKQTH